MSVVKSKRSQSKIEFENLYFKLADNGYMSENDVWNCYQSWRGTIVKEHNACYNSLKKMDELYYRLFPIHKEPKKIGRKEKYIKIFNTANSNDLNQLLN